MERNKPEEIGKYTEQQHNFMDALFDAATGGAAGDMRKAATIAGYSKNTKLSQIIKPLKEEIVDRAYLHLAGSSPKAVFKLVGVMDNPTALGNREMITAAKEVLDRGGIIRTEKVIHDVPSNAVFILPAKNEIKEEDADKV